MGFFPYLVLNSRVPPSQAVWPVWMASEWKVSARQWVIRVAPILLSYVCGNLSSYILKKLKEMRAEVSWTRLQKAAPISCRGLSVSCVKKNFGKSALLTRLGPMMQRLTYL